MKRREFITPVGGAAAAWPLAARAQQAERIRRVGVLMAVAESDADVRSGVALFQQCLQELGWKDSRNIRIDYRWGDADAGRIQALAKELVGLQPDVLVAHSTPSARGLLQATRSIPIVFLTVTDPLGQGLVASLSRPGGNITGFSVFEFSLGTKWVEVLKQIAPSTRRVTAIFNPETAPYYGMYLRSIEAATAAIPVESIAVRVYSETDIKNVIRKVGSEPDGGLFVCPTAITWSIASRSSNSQQNIACRRSIISAILHPTVASSLMAPTKWISSYAPRPMLTEF
jgi:putative tryptophan/tyrosine transport system substrate-binding protein